MTDLEVWKRRRRGERRDREAKSRLRKGRKVNPPVWEEEEVVDRYAKGRRWEREKVKGIRRLRSWEEEERPDPTCLVLPTTAAREDAMPSSRAYDYAA